MIVPLAIPNEIYENRTIKFVFTSALKNLGRVVGGAEKKK